MCVYMYMYVNAYIHLYTVDKKTKTFQSCSSSKIILIY